VKVFLAGNALKECCTAVEKRTAGTIPIHRESIDAHSSGTFNLLAKDIGVLRAVTNVDVIRISKPWLIVSHDFRAPRKIRNLFQRNVPHGRMIA